jgi:hypothetical protein
MDDRQFDLLMEKLEMIRCGIIDVENAAQIVNMEIPSESYDSIRDTIVPDCMQCRVHGRCSVSSGSECCKHLFWCNKHT